MKVNWSINEQNKTLTISITSIISQISTILQISRLLLWQKIDKQSNSVNNNERHYKILYVIFLSF